MDRSHEDYRGLVASYVLGAVPSGELADVSRHIVSCEECLEEADGYSEVTAALALAVDPATVPAGFAARVMEQVAGDQLAPSAAPASRRRWPMFAKLVSGLAITIAAVVATVVLLDQRSDLARNQQVVALLARSDGLELSGQEGATARLVTEEGRTAFVGAGLDPAPGGRTYQLWLVRDGRTISAGTFSVEDGEAVHLSDLSLKGVDEAAVTVEPSGGSKQPTTKPVLTSA